MSRWPQKGTLSIQVVEEDGAVLVVLALEGFGEMPFTAEDSRTIGSSLIVAADKADEVSQALQRATRRRLDG